MVDHDNTTAGAIMHDGCVTIEADSSVAHAARIMHDRGIGALPIRERGGTLRGMLTDRDIVTRCIAAGCDPRSTTVGEIASEPLLFIETDQGAWEVLDMMEDHQVTRIPVIERGGNFVGMISKSDVALNLGREQVGELIAAVSRDPIPIRSW